MANGKVNMHLYENDYMTTVGQTTVDIRLFNNFAVAFANFPKLKEIL